MSEKENGKKHIGISAVAAIILCALLAAGVMTLFKACGSLTEGITMNCQYAQIAVFIIAAVMTALCIAAVFAGRTLSVILRVAVMVLALVAAVIPGNVISLCMYSTMSCQAMMRPYTVFMAVLIIICTLICVAAEKKNG